jgi:hypothetical protein
MSQIRNSIHASFQAAASITAYCAVAGFSTAAANINQVALWDTETKAIIGMSADDYSTNAGADIIIMGSAKGLCSASVTQWKPVAAVTGTGALLESTNTASTVASAVILPQAGIALANGSANSVIEVLVRPTNFGWNF